MLIIIRGYRIMHNSTELNIYIYIYIDNVVNDQEGLRILKI